MIGYKAFDENLCCRGFQFEIGKTYTKNVLKKDMKICTDTVFHFCRELFAIEQLSEYKLSESRICEILTGEDVIKDGGKYGTNEITILREIKGDEKKHLLDTGDWNTGNYNTGSYNTGNRNTGYHNAGHYNTGSCNTGDHNTGGYNTGNYNTGYHNTGNFNTGYHNAGNRNTGYYNIGNRNTGDWNAGSYNTGFFNTSEPSILIFNQETTLKRGEIIFPKFLYFDLTTWVSHDTATQEEKENHKQEIEICGGFTKFLDYKEAFKLAYNKASDDEKIQLFKLPNFNCEIFEEISGINTKDDYQRLMR